MRRPVKKSVEISGAVEALRRQINLERRESTNPAVTTNLKAYSRAIKPRNLQVTQADVDAGKAPEGSVGKFWVVPGYSDPNGPDVIRP